jgi:hypothetical protein
MTHYDRTWTTQPEATALVTLTLDDALAAVPDAQALASRLRDNIGVRLIDILDYISLPEGSNVSAFVVAGWEPDAADPTVLRNPTGLFPVVLTRGHSTAIGFKVEYVHEFVAAQGLSAPVEGAMHAPFRRVRFAEAGGVNAASRATPPADLPHSQAFVRQRRRWLRRDRCHGRRRGR